ncbi:MAG: hypothetical protein AAF206_20470 [Bacteroidota bacterium]
MIKLKETYAIQTRYRRRLADAVTPVSVYLRLRDRFANAILLESSDYHGNDNTYSYICFEPLAGLKLQNGQLEMQLPDGDQCTIAIQGTKQLPTFLQQFLDSFQTEEL